MIQSAQKELTKLEEEFQQYFEETEKELKAIRDRKWTKIRTKEKIEHQFKTISNDLERCKAEIRAVEEELTQKEALFDSHIKEHSEKLETLRKRIERLNPNGEVPDGAAALPKPSIPTEIKDDLECLCCFEVMGLDGAYIYQCTEGHLICPKCHKRLSNCPVCRKPYKKPGIRNRMAEALASYLNKNNSV